MGRQKAVIKARREAKRVLRRDSRSHKQREEESVTSLVQMGGVEAIGMARDSRDTSPILARNEAQLHYLKAIESKQLIFATGEAGCGKTWISAAKAAEALIHKDVDRIIVTRPVLQADEDLGFLHGDIAEKFAPYFRPVYDVLVRRLGASFMQYCLRPEIGKVEIAPFAYMRGRTFENAVVILDEAQNVTAAQMKMFLTRLGENVTVIVNGDITQCDLPRGVCSGLSDALERFEEDEMVGIVRFGKEDCVRSALCQRTLHAWLSVLSVQSPGEPGFVLGVYARTSAFLKQPFLFAWLVKCTLILWLFVVADRAHQVLLSSLHILAAYIGRLHDAAVFENAAYCTAPRQLTRRHSPLPAKNRTEVGFWPRFASNNPSADPWRIRI